jgi:hypothetical protein
MEALNRLGLEPPVEKQYVIFLTVFFCFDIYKGEQSTFYPWVKLKEAI